MKIQVRQGVFETNSSSEHVVSVASRAEFDLWKRGGMYARKMDRHEDKEHTWGNFWSYLEEWEFKGMSDEEAIHANLKMFDEYVRHENKSIDDWEKFIDKIEETPFDLDTNKDCYYETPEEKAGYIKSARGFIQKDRNKINNLKYDLLTPLDKMYERMWITYEEWQDAMRHDNVYSPYLHEFGDLVVFGTYFHS